MPRPNDETLGYLYDRYIGDDPEMIAEYERSRADSAVASDIYRLRTEAGLSQRALAARIGTTASVICQLEAADYEGHSLSMLRRIAAALGRRVEVSFPLVTEPATSKKDTQSPAQTRRRAAISAPASDRLVPADVEKAPRRAAMKKRPR